MCTMGVCIEGVRACIEVGGVHCTVTRRFMCVD